MSQDKDRRIRKFNPGTFLSDDEVIEQFVVRNHELETVLNVLRGNVESPSCQHTLIVAPRGRGKTMLLARAAAELRENDEFSAALLPVRFMEESQEIFNMADFWLETLFHLAKECERTEHHLARELRTRHAALGKLWRNPELEDHARLAVLDAADRLGRKLVLMIENLQALSKDVDKDFGWKLRKVLQTEPQVMLVGSATSRFKELLDAELPYFELFRIIDLKPLNTDECRRLWIVVSGDSVSGREMRPLEILTGGSPRLLVIMAGFARHKSIRRLMEELVLLIDDHTEYFRGHLEALGKTERRVYLAVIDLWQLSSPSEISDRVRMDIRVVSTMLKRLHDRGMVKVNGRGRKRTYEAAEPLYSIYYKLRRDRDEATVVQGLIRCMAAYYTKEEQEELLHALIAEASDSPAIRAGLDRALAEMPGLAAIHGEIHCPEIERTPDEDMPTRQRRLLAEIMAAFRKGEYESVVRFVDQDMASQYPDPSRLRESTLSWALVYKAAALHQLGQLQSAASAFDEVIERFGNANSPQLQNSVAEALRGKGRVLMDQGKLEPALAVFEGIIERFGSANSPDLQFSVAESLSTKGYLLKAQNKLECALAAFEKVTGRYSTADIEELQRMVAQALIGKGGVLLAQGKLKRALAAFDEVIERFGTAMAPMLQLRVAYALANKGITLFCTSELTSAVLTLDTGIELIDSLDRADFSSAVAVALQRLAAYLLMAKGVALHIRGNPESALATLDELVECVDTAENPELQAWSVKSLVVKIRLQIAEGCVEDTLDTFRVLYSKYEPDNETSMREILKILIKLVGAGVDPRALLRILSSDESRKVALFPAVVALRQEAGEEVRAPGEVLAVAGDMREDIEKARLPAVELNEVISYLFSSLRPEESSNVP